jgi:hypothetical protein
MLYCKKKKKTGLDFFYGQDTSYKKDLIRTRNSFTGKISAIKKWSEILFRTIILNPKKICIKLVHVKNNSRMLSYVEVIFIFLFFKKMPNCSDTHLFIFVFCGRFVWSFVFCSFFSGRNLLTALFLFRKISKFLGKNHGLGLLTSRLIQNRA